VAALKIKGKILAHKLQIFTKFSIWRPNRANFRYQLPNYTKHTFPDCVRLHLHHFPVQPPPPPPPPPPPQLRHLRRPQRNPRLKRRRAPSASVVSSEAANSEAHPLRPKASPR
jgi:hypothetical protein